MIVTISMVSVSTRMANTGADVTTASKKETTRALYVMIMMNALARTVVITVTLMLNVQIHLAHITVLVQTNSLAMVSVMMVVSIKMNVVMPLVHLNIKGPMKHFSLLTNAMNLQLVQIRPVVTTVPVT